MFLNYAGIDCLNCCLSALVGLVIFLLPAGVGIVFTHRPIFGFLAPQRRHVAPIKVKFGRGGSEHTVCSSLPNFISIGSGLWVYGPQNFENSEFYQYNCTILTKFTGFMRVVCLHKVAKSGCFSSINDKIIVNLPRWGRFQPNFR